MLLDIPPPRTTRFGSPLNLARVHWVRPELVIEVAFLAWTSRITFYERLGYTVWREYRTATRPLG